MSRVLMLVTAANSITLADGTAHPTGYWAEELVTAHRELRNAGVEVTIATPEGRTPTVDPGSLDPATVGDATRAAEFARYLDGISAELAHPLAVEDVRIDDFDAVVLPGGHGPMVDLAFDPNVGATLLAADDAGVVIAPFCHGPAALLSATRQDGSFGFAGRTVAVFTDEEELSGGLGENTPFLVATSLRERGAVIDTGAAWTSHVVRDGNLISGQNPQSSEAVAAAVIAALAE